MVTIYDQYGTFNCIQPNAGNQPSIYVSGTYLGWIQYDGSTSAMYVSSPTMGTPYAGIYCKISQPNDTSYRMLFELTSDGTANAGGLSWYVQPNNAQQQVGMGNNGGAQSTNFNTASLTSLSQTTTLYDRTLTGYNQTKLRQFGNYLTTDGSGTSAQQVGNFANAQLNVGVRNQASLYSTMHIDTIAIYTANSLSLVTSIEAIVA